MRSRFQSPSVALPSFVFSRSPLRGVALLHTCLSARSMRHLPLIPPVTRWARRAANQQIPPFGAGLGTRGDRSPPKRPGPTLGSSASHPLARGSASMCTFDRGILLGRPQTNPAAQDARAPIAAHLPRGGRGTIGVSTTPDGGQTDFAKALASLPKSVTFRNSLHIERRFRKTMESPFSLRDEFADWCPPEC